MIEPLSAAEARILGSLIEKEATTPEQYPLTENAVLVACNQKTAREPVMELSAGDVGHALRQMEPRGLVRSVHGARAQRYEHRFDKAFTVTAQQQALLAILLLRGAQTLAELHARTERLAKFATAEDVRHALDRLLEREFVVRLPKAPGQREERWMHLLSGPVDIDALAAATPERAPREPSGLEARIDALEARLAELERRLP
jgi:uncharacterized protein YceH (UPF0502 family)